jgi:hypothetical protein
MVKGILALALLGFLTAGDALAAADSNRVMTSIQVAPAITVDQTVAHSPAQTAASAVEGTAVSLGSSAPQPLGQPASAQPAPRKPAPPARRPTCPAGQHLGIACIGP